MAKKKNDSLIVDTVHLEGALFVPDILDKIIRGEHTHQTTEDYRIPKGLKLHEEYGRAFQIAQAQWKTFEPQAARADMDKRKVTIHFVTELLKDVLGYSDIKLVSDPIEIADRHYPVTAMACGRIPVVIAPHDLDLDEADPTFSVEGMGARKISASRLTQMFLDASEECTWALVSNGKKLRLLRDTSILTRPTFLECDLDTVLSEKRYPDFSALWRMFHTSRAGEPDTPGTSCIWETWREDGKEQGTRVREGLRDGVTKALLSLGQGFIQHPSNTDLRSRLFDGTMTKNDFFQELLRLIYRFLFMFTVEERGLLHGDDNSAETRIPRERYWEGYALKRLRDRSLRKSGFDHYDDLWQSIQIVFRGLANGEPRLALPALGGLFASNHCPGIDACALTNHALLTAMRQLRWSANINGLSPVDFKNMGPEELGSVYESLLELVPHIDLNERHFGFVGLTEDGLTSGHDRKTTGSYYTPDSLVQELIRSALDPVIDARVKAHPDHPEDALLNITVIDPACGSGHFLLAAARRLAERLADFRSPDGTVKPEDYRHALREVIARCIYGVDRNPLALELARTVLWLEGFESGRALSFLDHHLVCGDALLGISHFDQMKNGIPDDAFKALSGDDRGICNQCRQENHTYRHILQRRRGDSIALLPELNDALDLLKTIEVMDDETPGQVHEKEKAYLEFLTQAQDSHLARASDIFIGAFLIPKTNGDLEEIPTSKHLTAELFGEQEQEEQQKCVELARQYCHKARVLHWPLTFPRIFAQGGFDCVLGNPPWERIKLQEQEFFATRSPDVATAKNKAEREKRVNWLSQGMLARNLKPNTLWDEDSCGAEIKIYQDFICEKRISEAASLFAHIKGDDGGRFPLTGKGDVNTYALFAETNKTITVKSGRSGFIVPTGIATDDSTKVYFADITLNNRLVSLYDFENREKIFSDVDSRFKFCLITLGKSQDAQFVFFLTQPNQLGNEERRFTLSPDDFVRINPNTRTCPVFRSQMDAEITRKIYLNVLVLIRETTDELPGLNPWGISFLRMFDMSNDSGLFKSRRSEDDLPIYEAKMLHQFDHRWAGFRDVDTENPVTVDITTTEKQNKSCFAEPRYWIRRRYVLSRIARVPKLLSKAYILGDEEGILKIMANWIDSLRKAPALETGSQMKTAIVEMAGKLFMDLSDDETKWRDARLQSEMKSYLPLEPDEFEQMKHAETILIFSDYILDKRSPRWLMGFRDICRSTDERTVITSVLSRAGVGNNFPILYFDQQMELNLFALLLGNLDSMVLDFVARHKVGGTHLNFFIAKQLPVLSPESYCQKDIDFIVPRVLELTYTTHDLKPWAEDLGYSGEPFTFDPERRAQIRAELDAYYARLYGLSRDELRYILDPSEIMGQEYPSETFRVLKNNEIKEYGEYRTGRMVLEYYDTLMREESIQRPSKSHIAATGYPGTPLNRFICSFTLALVESRSTMGSMNILEALIVMKQQEYSRAFLSETENTELDHLYHDAGLVGEAESPVQWSKCRDYLENTRKAIQIDRIHPDQMMSKGLNFGQTKETLPQVPDRLVALVLKTLATMDAVKQKADPSNEKQTAMIQYLESERERLAS